MAQYHKRTAPRRYCAECGTYVGHRWAQHVLCDPCSREAFAAARTRAAERQARREA